MKLRRKTRAFLLLSLVLQVAISFILMAMPSTGDFMKIQTAFTVQSFTAVLEGWTDLNRATFLLHYSLDFFYPVAYSLALYFLMQDLGMKIQLCRVAFVAGICDEIENIFHSLLINKNIDISALNVFCGAMFATLKWLILIYLAVLIIANLGKRFKKRAQLG